MLALARLYALTSYFHPHWDEAQAPAWVSLLEKPSRATLVAALAALNDPLTGLVEEGVPSGTEGTFFLATTTEGAPVLTLSEPGLLLRPEQEQRFGEYLRSVLAAPVLLLDLQGTRPPSERAVANLVRLTEGIARPTVWQRAHFGKVPEGEPSTGGFRSGWLVREAALSVARWPQTAVLVNQYTLLPPFVVALQQLGKAAVFFAGEGELDTRWRGSWTELVVLGETVRLRTGLSTVALTGRFPTPVAARTAALAWLAKPTREPRIVPSLPPVTVPAAPSSRAHAALRLWSTLWLLHPDRERLGPVLERAWPTFWQSVRAAATPLAFHQAVRGLLAQTGDGHAAARSPLDMLLFGEAAPPVRVREVEGQPTVVRLLSPAAEAGGLAVGDVVQAVDGVSVAQRRAALTPWLASSTPQGLGNYLSNRLLLGPAGSMARLVVRGKDGKPKTAFCPREPSGGHVPERSGAVVRELQPGVVYVDLDRLSVAEVAPLFARYGTARTLIFDLRGYVEETAWALAPYLNPRPGTVAAQVVRPVAVPPERGESKPRFLTETFPLELPPPGTGKPFRGKLVCLIDERTQSQSELTALFLAACGAVFVGSPSAGAVGDVTSVLLTDGILVRFSGQDVRYPDGRIVARKGFQPHVRVTPSLAGIRAGRDEVLERALTSPPPQ